MKAIDTNVLVRLITRDDPEQLQQARAVFQSGPCFLAETVLLETAWVLRCSYGAARDQVYAELVAILGLANGRLADRDRIRTALEWYRDGLDIADAFHLSALQAADVFITFDRRMIRLAAGVGSCPVSAPDM